MIVFPAFSSLDYIALPPLPEGSGWITSVGDYVDNSFAALGSSDPWEVRLEL